MENKSPQGMKVPLIVAGIAVLVIAVGLFVRTPPPETVPMTDLVPTTEGGEQFTGSSLAAKDEKGDSWMLSLKMGPAPGGAPGVNPGTPIFVKADVQGDGPNKTIGLLIEGAAGEVYQPTVIKNGAVLPPPKFSVLDETGQVIGSGAFEYG